MTPTISPAQVVCANRTAGGKEEAMKTFTWTVEITVDQTWVEDGFELTDERAYNMIAEALPFAYGHEFSAKVVKSPDKAEIRKVQGYKD